MFRRLRLPRYIVQLIQKKKQLWLIASVSKNYTEYKATYKITRTAIKQHCRNIEWRLIYSNNRKAIFSYIHSKINKKKRPIYIDVDGVTATDKETASIFLCEFSNNFSMATVVNDIVNAQHNEKTDFQLSCTELMIAKVSLRRSSSKSSSDGILYKLLKTDM